MKGKTSSNGLILRFAFIAITVLSIGLATSGLCQVAKPAGSDIVVRWGSHVITKEDVDIRISQYPPDMQEKLKDPVQRQQYLESLIQIQVAGAEARARKVDKKKKVALRIDDTVNSILLQEYMNDKIKTLKAPTEKEAETFFAAHKGEYVTPVFIRAQHILIEAKPDAKPEDVAAAEVKVKKVYEELAAGGDFAKLAEKYSDDAETKTKGGDLGLFNHEQMVPEFSNPVFGMKKDELSKPFRTPFGFHIVRVNDLLPAKQMEFKDVKDDVIMRLDNQNRDSLVYGELDRLKKKYNVKIIEPKAGK